MYTGASMQIDNFADNLAVVSLAGNLLRGSLFYGPG